MIGLLQSFTAFSQDKVVNFYNWADYIGEDTIENFQEEYGIKSIMILMSPLKLSKQSFKR